MFRAGRGWGLPCFHWEAAETGVELGTEAYQHRQSNRYRIVAAIPAQHEGLLRDGAGPITSHPSRYVLVRPYGPDRPKALLASDRRRLQAGEHPGRGGAFGGAATGRNAPQRLASD